MPDATQFFFPAFSYESSEQSQPRLPIQVSRAAKAFCGTFIATLSSVAIHLLML